jgi:hypothetical protein
MTFLDSETGLPLALIDGNWVTEKRTAGLSAVAAKRLARNDSVSAGFIGCGVQARGHLDRQRPSYKRDPTNRWGPPKPSEISFTTYRKTSA